VGGFGCCLGQAVVGLVECEWMKVQVEAGHLTHLNRPTIGVPTTPLSPVQWKMHQWHEKASIMQGLQGRQPSIRDDPTIPDNTRVTTLITDVSIQTTCCWAYVAAIFIF